MRRLIITCAFIFSPLFITELLAAPVFLSQPNTEVNGNPEYKYSIIVDDTTAVSISATVLPSWLSLSTDPIWYTSTFVGGEGEVGFLDGPANIARFKNMYGIVVDDNGDMYIADTHNHAIRKVNGHTGQVATVAGNGSRGNADEFGEQARFFFPQGIDEHNGFLYVADAFNHSIRKVDIASGSVTTIAGSSAEIGTVDGPGTEARFNFPKGIAVDDEGGIWVADSGNHQIRYINEQGTVTTIAGSLNASSGNTNGIGQAASFNSPRGMTVTDDGYLYIADKDNHQIRRLNRTSNEVITIAGSGSAGDVDGIAAAASFFHPFDVTVDSDGNLFVPDSSNHQIRKVLLPSQEVITIAGNGIAGFADGTDNQSQFYFPRAVSYSPNRNIFVADRSNGSIREILEVDAHLTGSAEEFGDYSVSLNATSINGSTDQSYTLSVTAINDRPQISGTPTTSIMEGEPYSFTPAANDSNEDDIIFSVKMLPSWASFDETTGTVSGTPSYTDAKLYVHIAVTADDKTATDNATNTLAPYNIVVNDVNHAPSLSGSPDTAIETEAFSFTPTLTDKDTDNTHTYTAKNLPTWININTLTGELYGEPNHEQSGTYSDIVISVDDGSLADNASSDLTISIQIDNKDRAPKNNISIPDITLTANDDFIYALPENIFVDEDNDPLSMALEYGEGDWLTLQLNGNKYQLTGKPTNDNVGEHEFILTATDTFHQASASTVLKVSVEKNNGSNESGGYGQGLFLLTLLIYVRRKLLTTSNSKPAQK